MKVDIFYMIIEKFQDVFVYESEKTGKYNGKIKRTREIDR